MQPLKFFLQLTKVRIGLLITLSTVTGFVIASSGSTEGMAGVAVGMFLLSCGSVALNQYQDREIDMLMERTRRRPIAAGVIGPGDALIISIMLILSGCAVLFFCTNTTVLLLGLSALFMYNLFYTYLKRKNAFSFLPGAVIGALPPAAGWSAGGGSLYDPSILALSFFLFIWQIPHFLLILLRYRDEYEKAGLPVVTEVFSVAQLRRILSIWILATVVTSLSLPVYLAVSSRFILLCLVAAALWLAFETAFFLKDKGKSPSLRTTILEVNVYALLVLLLLSIDALIYH
ncbi:MAG: protoheme IX farnesyltransferase [Candidatus Glassbacteria bacterium]